MGWDWSPKLNIQTIGGTLLASGAIANMFVSTDKRTSQQICRVLAAAFGAYLVGEGTWHPSANLVSTPMNTFVVPAIGMSAVIAGLAWLGVMIFGKKK